VEKLSAACRSDFLFAQGFAEGFLAFSAVKKSDFYLGLLSRFVRSASHHPFLFRRSGFCPACLAFCQTFTSIIVIVELTIRTMNKTICLPIGVEKPGT
jgi:hypothetical protein